MSEYIILMILFTSMDHIIILIMIMYE